MFDVNCYIKMQFKPDHFKRCSQSYISPSSSSSFANSMLECVRDCRRTPNSPVLCLPQIRVEADIQWYQIVLHALGPESILFYGVLLVLIIWFQVSLLWPAKLSDEHPFEKLWQRDRINITGLDDDVDRKRITSFESHLLVQIAILFNIQYLYKKCFKVPTEKYTFPITAKIILIF